MLSDNPPQAKRTENVVFAPLPLQNNGYPIDIFATSRFVYTPISLKTWKTLYNHIGLSIWDGKFTFFVYSICVYLIIDSIVKYFEDILFEMQLS